MVKKMFMQYFEEYVNRAQKIKKILARNQGILLPRSDLLERRLANLRPLSPAAADELLERRLANLRPLSPAAAGGAAPPPSFWPPPSFAAGMQFSLVGATCGLGSGMSNAMVTNALHFGPLLARLHVASLTRRE